MKTIYNKFLPFRGFRCMNLFGVLFVRREFRGTITDIDINHEKIHSAQFKELLYIFYYPIYWICWIIEIIRPPYETAYRDTCFEREAYFNEKNLNYLKTRRHYVFLKYWNKKEK